ncbi:TPA: hypothetical protein JZG55_003068 [Escherichia coli]|nr:hypothetical protein [Escherichia coli]HAX5118950.1 hypothetical protein [Escherichia coli]HAX5129420.1 hypothetical protein [Escherichia coli]HAX5179907.1 hypothetical protein [Escherichia coli]HAX5226967.1 hypothetical protein [Escherichia coli]
MKKTLIALAVAASAVVSGSAMASGWEQNGNGTSVEIGGTLTPVEKVTPWEVKTGDAVTDLDAQVQKGQTSVTVNVSKAIPVLGIRTQTADVFTGMAGISPQINYGGAIDVDGFSAGVTTLTLDVTDANGEKMGTMSAPFLAGAGVSRTGTNTDAYSAYVYDNYDVSSFKGGLGDSSEEILPNLATVISRVGALDSEFTANFNQQGVSDIGVWRATPFENTGTQYSGFYGSGIESGSKIAITLDTAVSGDGEIAWKATLPVTVTYM